MQVTCRPAQPVDDAALEALRIRAREAVVDQRGGAALLAELDASASVGVPMVWCAAIDDVVVGYAEAVLRRDPVTVLVRAIWVDPDAREVGAGEALLSAVLAWGIAEEATAVDALALPGSRELKNLFERMGLTTRLLTVRRELG